MTVDQWNERSPKERLQLVKAQMPTTYADAAKMVERWIHTQYADCSLMQQAALRNMRTTTGD